MTNLNIGMLTRKKLVPGFICDQVTQTVAPALEL